MSQPAIGRQRAADPGHVPHEDQDLLDVAYIALGASHALAAWAASANRRTDGPTDRFEGQLGYIQACIDQAPLLHRLWLECGEENSLT